MSYARARHINQRISIQHLWGLVVLAGVFVFVNTHPIRPHDFWWHMAIGREILSSGQIPLTDIYSYTALGTFYPSYQSFWLMDVVLYFIFQTGGAALVVFFQSLVITSAYLLVFLTCWHETRDWRAAAFGLAFAAGLGMNDWNVRPQAITFLLGALFLYLIQQLRRGARSGWAILLPAGMILWVNSHGTFLLGIFFIGLWFGQEAWDVMQTRRLSGRPIAMRKFYLTGIIFLLSLLACLVNPRGFGILQYLGTIGGNEVIQNMVVEWAPPTIHTLSGRIFLGALLLTAVVIAISPKRPSIFHLGGFIGMAILGLLTSRGIIWFGLAMAPVVAVQCLGIIQSIKGAENRERRYDGKPLVNWILLGSIVIVAVITLPWFKENLPMPASKAGLISMETPVKATEYLLDNSPDGNLFHAISFGSYLIWAAQPDYPVFVDGRIEMYPTQVWMDYLQISQASGDWEQRLQDYGVRALLLSNKEQPGLVEAVKNNPHWKLLYEDEAALLFVSR